LFLLTNYEANLVLDYSWQGSR